MLLCLLLVQCLIRSKKQIPDANNLGSVQRHTALKKITNPKRFYHKNKGREAKQMRPGISGALQFRAELKHWQGKRYQSLPVSAGQELLSEHP